MTHRDTQRELVKDQVIGYSLIATLVLVVLGIVYYHFNYAGQETLIQVSFLYPILSFSVVSLLFILITGFLQGTTEPQHLNQKPATPIGDDE